HFLCINHILSEGQYQQSTTNLRAQRLEGTQKLELAKRILRGKEHHCAHPFFAHKKLSSPLLEITCVQE
ncbi:hypothetical protein HispidOSU_024165, partial [Sigmodon hispidus]